MVEVSEIGRAAFDSRGTAWEISRKTTDPQRARRNLLERDRMFTDELLEETNGLELPIIEVDIAMTEDELTRRVMQAFGLRASKVSLGGG